MNHWMQRLLQSTRGKKTYSAVVIGLVYLVGAGLGWWEYDSEVANGIILAALAALRMASGGKEGA